MEFLMAVGDVISQTYAPALQSFQPAAGVHIMVLSCWGRHTAVSYGITDGAQPAYTDYNDNGTTGARDSGLIKVGITNTYYLYMIANAIGVGFTGIQIK
jgi:hypothetical protein